MCPLRDDFENCEYRPISVNNIIATFERLAISDKPHQIVRSGSAVYSRNKTDKQCATKQRHAKSEIIYNHDSDKNPIYENVGFKKKESSEKRIQRLESISEAESIDSNPHTNVNEVRSRAQAVLKKYENEVIANYDETIHTHIYNQSIFLIGNEIDDDSDPEDFRSRTSSVSIDEEYVSLREVQNYPIKTNFNSEDEYCTLCPPSDDEGRYVPQYENISAIKEMGKLTTYKKKNKLVRSNTVKQNKSLVNTNLEDSSKRAGSDKKKFTVDELIQTEETYIKDLTFVITNYMQYISEIYTGFPLRRYNNIFINIEMICYESQKLLVDIKHQGYNYEAIGRIFCKYRPLMERYTVYCKNKKISEELIKGEYAEIIEIRRKEIGDPLGLTSYLLKPIQRILRYQMFLRNLQKYITREGGGVTCIKEAINLIKRTARRGNDLIIISCIQDMPHHITDTGDFIMGDSFKMLTPKKMDIELFLFKNMIVFAVKKGVDSFIYKTYIPVENLTKCNDGHKTTITLEDYFMKKKHKDPSYILDAMSMEKKKKWIECIDEILWRQLHEIKARAKNNTYL